MNYSLSTFTAPNDVRLDQYVGELNAAWQRIQTISWPNLNRITNGRVHRTWENPNLGTPNHSGSEHYLSTYTIPSASYVVEAEVWNIGVFSEWRSDGLPIPVGTPNTVHPNGTITRTSEGFQRANSNVIIGGRASIGQFNGYRVQYDQLNALWSLQKVVNHSTISINRTFFDIIPFGQSRLVQLVLRGYWVEMWIDGINRQFFRDEGVGAFSTAGFTMLRFDSGPDNWSLNEFSIRGLHLDNFRVHDEFPPLPITEEMMLFGTGNSSGQVLLSWTE